MKLVWEDTAVHGSGTINITVTTSANEKRRFSVCLAAKADGPKSKPMILFKGGKQEVNSLNEEYKNCVILSLVSTWMNNPLKNVSVNEGFGSFSFCRGHLIRDLYDCHTETSVKASLNSQKNDTTIILGTCRKYPQAQDVCTSKSFKVFTTEVYDQWLSEEGINQETPIRNLESPP